jgi:hypothetical protein
LKSQELERFKTEYVEFLHREAIARVDAGGIPPQWQEPGGLKIAWKWFEQLDKGFDRIIKEMATDAMRAGDRHDIANHLSLNLETYPEMKTFLGEALLSPKSKFANRPPRVATGAQQLWMARYVAFEKRRHFDKTLSEIYEDAAALFGKTGRTVANAYRARKEDAASCEEFMIDKMALLVAILRAHP